MKIAVLHRANLTDVRVLSGTPFYMMQALAEHVGEVIPVCPDRSRTTRAVETVGKIVNRLSLKLTGKHISSDHNHALSRRLGHVFTKRLASTDCDVVFAPMASAEIAYLQTDKPIVYLSDLTWINIVDYYPGATNLHAAAARSAEEVEVRAMAKPVAHIYPSQWAADTAAGHYGVPTDAIHVVPFAANFVSADIPSRETALAHSITGSVQLLWVGVNWDRKGGPIAHAALLQLLQAGVDARLVVCGCVPPASFQHERMEVVPFLSKHNVEQRKRLSQLFLESTFFIFPTQAEATPIVLSEASAHGLPSLVRNTGGVGGALRDGENGFLMPPDATGADYAQKILDIRSEPTRYQAMVEASRSAFEQRLNWNAWGQAVKPIFHTATRKLAP